MRVLPEWNRTGQGNMPVSWGKQKPKAEPAHRPGTFDASRFQTTGSAAVAPLLRVYFGVSNPPPPPPSPLTNLVSAVENGRAFGTRRSLFTPQQQQAMRLQAEQDGYLRLPPQTALNQLAQDPELVLSLVKAIARGRGVLPPNGIFPSQPASPFHARPKDWFSRTPTQVLNLANLTRTEDGPNPNQGGGIWLGILYLLTTPAGNIHLLPWHEKDLDSNYTPNNPFRMDPALESPELTSAGLRGNDQLKLLADVGHLLGKTFVYDLLPHAGHFSAPALLKPQLFRWIQYDLEKVRSLPRQPNTPEDIRELFSFQEARRLINGNEIRSRSTVERLAATRAGTSDVIKSQDQATLVETVRNIVRTQLGQDPDTVSMASLTPEKREALAKTLIEKGLWTMPRHAYNAWNPEPLVKGYHVGKNYPLYLAIDRTNLEDAAYQMFPFSRLRFQDAQGNLNEAAMSFFESQLIFADGLGLADMVRLDQLDWLGREQHVYDPIPPEVIQRLTRRFPDKVFLAERLEGLDFAPYQAAGARAIIGGDWSREIHQSDGLNKDFFHRAWDDDQAIAAYNQKNKADMTALRAFQLHDQHMQPGQVSPFDPARGGIAAGEARLLTMLFINGDQGTNKPFYGIMGDEVALGGQSVYRGSFTPNTRIPLQDTQGFYPTYANAMALRYGTPRLKQIQNALKTGADTSSYPNAEVLLAKAQAVLRHGKKTWDTWSKDGNALAWCIERTDGQPGKILVAVNRQRPDKGAPSSQLLLGSDRIGNAPVREILLKDPQGPQFQPTAAKNGLALENLLPSQVRLFYLD